MRGIDVEDGVVLASNLSSRKNAKKIFIPATTNTGLLDNRNRHW